MSLGGIIEPIYYDIFMVKPHLRTLIIAVLQGIKQNDNAGDLFVAAG